MKNIFESAAKISFLLLILTTCIAFLTKTMESKDFMLIAGAATTFFFTYKPSPPVSEESRKQEPPFAGK